MDLQGCLIIDPRKSRDAPNESLLFQQGVTVEVSIKAPE